MPVVLSTAVDLYQIRLVLSYEPDKLELVGFNAKYTDPAGAPGEKFLRVTDRPPVLLSLTCEGEYPHIVCKQGKPLEVFLRGDGNGDTVPSGAVVLDFMTAYYMKELDNPPDVLFWEAEKSYDLGDLVFRVPETTPPDSVLQVSGTRVRWTPNVDAFVEVDSETAGFPPDVPREGRLAA